MPEATPRDAHKRQLAANFNALAPTYDQLRFLQICAERLVERMDITAGARVLDVGTGTGVVALAAAQRVGPGGRVVAIDLSPEMLALARKKAEAAGLNWIEFREGDTEHLDFPDGSFDVVLCASSLFFVPDMLAAAREWRRVLVPGGAVGFSSFGQTFLQPLRDVWEKRLHSYGLAAAALPTHRLADASTCETLVCDAGFSEVNVLTEQLGYYVPSPQHRWSDVMAGIEGKPLLQLPPDQRERVQAEHLAELAGVATAEGVWIDVPALFAHGRREATG